MATLRIVAISSNIETLESEINKTSFQTPGVEITMLKPLQTVREVRDAFENYDRFEPDIVLLGSKIINDTGLQVVPTEVIELLRKHHFNGPIVAWSDIDFENRMLMCVGATHRVTFDPDRPVCDLIDIDERQELVKKVILEFTRSSELAEVGGT